MSDSEGDEIQTSREEDVLAYEIYFWIVRCNCEKGVVKISELRKMYQKVVEKDKSVQFRPLSEILKTVNENLLHWQGWNAVMQGDRINYVKMNGKEMTNTVMPSETERTLGVLKNALMYVFIATKPYAKYPGVTHEDLMKYMEASMSTQVDNKLSPEHMELLKKQISPNPRAEFIRKGYLAFSKSVNEHDEDVFRYEWGPTALQTVDPVELVQIFQKLAGMEPSQLKGQIERARELKNKQLEAIKKGVVLPTRGKNKRD